MERMRVNPVPQNSLHGAEAVAQVTWYQGHWRFYRAVEASDAHETPVINKNKLQKLPDIQHSTFQSTV